MSRARAVCWKIRTSESGNASGLLEDQVCWKIRSMLEELPTFLLPRIKDSKIQPKKNSTFVTAGAGSRLPKIIMPDMMPSASPQKYALRFRKLGTTSDCKGACLNSSAILVTADTFSSFKKSIATCSTFDELLARTSADVSSASHVLAGDGQTLIIQEVESDVELLKKRREASPDCKGARLDSSAILVTADTFSSFKKNIASCSTFDELLARTAADVSSAPHVLAGDGQTLIIQEAETEELLKKYREALKKCVGCSSAPAAALTGAMVREAVEAISAYKRAVSGEFRVLYRGEDNISRTLDDLRYSQSSLLVDRTRL